jgi:hypothetical protein
MQIGGEGIENLFMNTMMGNYFFEFKNTHLH